MFVTEWSTASGADLHHATFQQYLLGTALHPRQTFRELLRNRQRLTLGAKALGLNAFLYTLVYVFLLAGGGAPSTFKPWLAIPAGDYYRYNVFLLAPSMVMCWLLSAAVAQLLSKAWGGIGRFEDMLSVFGFSILAASSTTLVHDLVTSFLGAIRFIDQAQYEVAMNTPTVWRALLWVLMTAYLLCFGVLFTHAVSIAQRLSRGPAAVVGVASFLVYQSVFLIFNR